MPRIVSKEAYTSVKRGLYNVGAVDRAGEDAGMVVLSRGPEATRGEGCTGRGLIEHHLGDALTLPRIESKEAYTSVKRGLYNIGCTLTGMRTHKHTPEHELLCRVWPTHRILNPQRVRVCTPPT